MRGKDLSKMQSDFAEKLQKAELENQLMEALPDFLEPFDVSVYRHKDEAWVTIKATGYRPDTDQQPTLEDVRNLAEQFEPMPLWNGKGTFRHIDTWEYFQGERQQREYPELGAIAPFVLTYEPASYSQKTSLQWWAMVDGQRTRFEFEWPMYHASKWFGRVAVTTRMVRGVVVEIKEQRIEIPERIYVLGGTRYDAIKWASGSYTTPSKWTVYYGDSGLTLADLINAVEVKE